MGVITVTIFSKKSEKGDNHDTGTKSRDSSNLIFIQCLGVDLFYKTQGILVYDISKNQSSINVHPW